MKDAETQLQLLLIEALINIDNLKSFLKHGEKLNPEMESEIDSCCIRARKFLSQRYDLVKSSKDQESSQESQVEELSTSPEST